MKTKRKKVGLALGSGGLKGFAHVGVIKVLEENNIPIDFYCRFKYWRHGRRSLCGRTDRKKIEEIALSTGWRKVFPFCLIRA